MERTGSGAAETRTTKEINSSEGATEMNCMNHTNTPATAYCRICGKALCEACQRTANGTVYCGEHLPAGVPVQTPIQMPPVAEPPPIPVAPKAPPPPPPKVPPPKTNDAPRPPPPPPSAP